MKTPRALIFAIGSGLVALILSYYYIAQKDKAWEGIYGNESVLISTVDVERYQPISPNTVRVELIPSKFVEPDALKEKDMPLLSAGQIIADSTIKAGSQITLTKISSPGDSLFSVSIPKDSRACTVAVNEITGVGGLIRPTDHIDIIGTFKSLDEKTRAANQVSTMTLFQNIPVLSVGRNYMYEAAASQNKEKLLSGGGNGSSNVTVAMTPRECMDLTTAQQVGVLTATLRSRFNRMGGKTFDELKTQHSTSSSVTGMKGTLEISKQPKWLEIRGEQSTLVP